MSTVTPPECVSLEGHEFSFQGLCGADADGPVEDDRNMEQLRYYGPLYTTETTVTAYFINAICEWDTGTGQPARLLAPKRADNWRYATAGDLTVNTRCDGALVIHADGCLTAELIGHETSADTPLDGIIQALLPTSDGQIVSLGGDDTIRLWDPGNARQLAVHHLEGFPAERALHADAAGTRLLVSALDGSAVEILDAQTLDPIDSLSDLPATVDGWRATGRGLLVGISPDGDSPAALLYDPEDAAITTIDTRRVPTALAISGNDDIAIADTTRVLLHDFRGQVHDVARSLAYCHALAFSPDGSVLYTADGVDGLASFDVATGTRLLDFSSPE